MSKASLWLSVGLLFALGAAFVAERVLGSGSSQNVVRGLGAAVLVFVVGLRALRVSQAREAARAVEARLLVFAAVIVAALALYILSLPEVLGRWELDAKAEERAAGTLAALWPAVMAVGVLATLFTEAAYRTMPVDAAIELRRVRNASYSGLGIAFVLIFAVSANYVAVKKEVKRDLSYFRTSKPSDGSLSMVSRLGEPVTIYLFFPKVSEVLDQVRPFFEALAKGSEKLSVEVRDQALEPELSREHQVRSNGFVVLVRGDKDADAKAVQTDKFEIGTTLERSRNALKDLDSRFQKSFSKLTQERRELYLTTGHEERTDQQLSNYPDGEKTRDLREALERSNVTTQVLGLSEGLGQAVPSAAKAVAVVGPRRPFAPEEAETLLRYVRDGGRLVVMVDPDVDHGLDPLFTGLGLQMQPGVVMTERDHLRRDNTEADRALVVSDKYSSHPTVTIASRNAARAPTVFVRAGALVKTEPTPPGLQIDFPIRSGPLFWRDLNGNFTRDEDEAKETVNFMAAVSLGEGDAAGRAVVVADGDLVTDQVIRFPGNILVFSDILQWLIGEEQIIGDVTSEEDVRIEHTRDEDKKWFYGGSFLPPMIPLGIGIWLAFRRRRKEKR